MRERRKKKTISFSLTSPTSFISHTTPPLQTFQFPNLPPPPSKRCKKFETPKKHPSRPPRAPPEPKFHINQSSVVDDDSSSSSSSSPERVYRWLKNKLVLFPLLESPPSLPPSCFCKLPMTGRTGPSATGPPPPPRRGFAIREPTPPKPAYEAPPAGDPPRPRVDPAFADSRRSFTAVSCASKLCGRY